MAKPKQETAIYSVHTDDGIVSVEATSINEAIKIATNQEEVTAGDAEQEVVNE